MCLRSQPGLVISPDLDGYRTPKMKLSAKNEHTVLVHGLNPGSSSHRAGVPVQNIDIVFMLLSLVLQSE